MVETTQARVGGTLDPLLADALTAIRALMAELETYTAVHGEDEDDEQALAMGRAVLSRANDKLTGQQRPEKGVDMTDNAKPAFAGTCKEGYNERT